MKRRQLIALGAMVILAVVLITKALLFLHPTPGDNGTVLHVRFSSIEKIAKGTRVTFAGRPIGVVDDIELLHDSFSERTAKHNNIFPYELTLTIDSSVKVYNTDEISIKTEGLMGERLIAITPCAPGAGQTMALVEPTDVLFATPPISVEQTFQKITNLAESADHTIASLEKTLFSIQQASECVQHFIQEYKPLAAPLISVVQSIDNGEGSLGKLVKTTELHNSLLTLSYDMKHLMKNINSHGLLFHLSRTWQRDELYDDSHKVTQAIQSLQEALQNAKATLDEGSLVSNKSLRQEFAKEVQQVKVKLDLLEHDLQQNDQQIDQKFDQKIDKE